MKFIFCTTEAAKIPITILSRCQRFDFAGIRPASIRDRLEQIVEAEGVEAEPEALALLARRANGSMRDSQSLLEQLLAFGQRRITAADVHAMLGTAADVRLAAIVDHLAEHDAAGALTAARRSPRRRGRSRAIARTTAWAIFAMPMAGSSAAAPTRHCTPVLLKTSRVLAVGRGLGLETILAIVQILDQALSRLRYSTQGRTLAEIALVRMCQPGKPR